MSIIIALEACILGILLSAYIYMKKKRHQSLACPREHPCDGVLHSRFGKSFRIPNELLGFAYFTFASILLCGLISAPAFYGVTILYILFFTLIIGGFFSIYLIALQAFVIRSWCAWCLGVAFTNFILILSLSNLPMDSLVSVFASQKVWWVIIHNFGFILGVGSATLTDVFFFRFLRDNAISAEEKETLDTFTTVIWSSLAILIVSGLALYIPQQVALAVSSKFLLKVVVVSVIIVNGVALNMFVGPHMRRLSFGGDVPSRRFRRLAFALGGISLTSWYIAFILGSLRKINFLFSHALIGYIVLLVCVVIGSQVFERIITKQHYQQS